MTFRANQTVIDPGFGIMDGDFTFYVRQVDHVGRRFDVAAGLMSGWRKMSDYRWDSERSRWVHRSLSLDIEP